MDNPCVGKDQANQADVKEVARQFVDDSHFAIRQHGQTRQIGLSAILRSAMSSSVWTLSGNWAATFSRSINSPAP